MSLLRTGHGPSDWRDEGPAPHVALHFRVGGSLAMPQAVRRVPGQSISIPTNAERARVARRLEAAKAKRAGLCNAPMRYGETCARRVGHNGGPGGQHRSRVIMDADAMARRGERL